MFQSLSQLRRPSIQRLTIGALHNVYVLCASPEAAQVDILGGSQECAHTGDRRGLGPHSIEEAGGRHIAIVSIPQHDKETALREHAIVTAEGGGVVLNGRVILYQTTHRLLLGPHRVEGYGLIRLGE